MEVYGKEKDLNAFFGLVSERQERVKQASPLPDMEDPIGDLSRMLHPEGIQLVVSAVREETPSVKTFRLEPAAGSGIGLPVFRPGQYVSLKAKIGDAWITRPYSISSSSCDALSSGYYELTIQKKREVSSRDIYGISGKMALLLICPGRMGIFIMIPSVTVLILLPLQGGPE